MLPLYRVRQRLVSHPIEDREAAVREQLDRLGPPPTGEVAITVGSRGIENLAEIIRYAGDWLRAQGARPFVVPCMGSHNGATAAGQRAMIESLGVTEQAVAMPIRASMDCVQVGEVSTGAVWMDRACYESAGVLVVNRIKLHTGFRGPIQSGLTKMMVVGMGKIRSAEAFHRAATAQMADQLAQMARVVIDSGKIWAGLAILEDGYDQTAELHALPAGDIPTEEPRLVERHLKYFPRLPLESINVLVVDQIGKTFSGIGMDPNVTGRRGVQGVADGPPDVEALAALDLAKASQGNALGVGLADCITQRLRDAIDEHKTLLNAKTTGEMRRAEIPPALADDQAVVEHLAQRHGLQGWVFIPNTLHLAEFWVTADLADQLRAHQRCEVSGEAVELRFRDGRHTLAYSSLRM